MPKPCFLFAFSASVLFLISPPKSSSAQCGHPSSEFPDTNKVQTKIHSGVTAHRGNSGSFPENTLASFASGIELEADWVELDVHLSRDGELVVIHDKTTGRTGDKDLKVAHTTYKELKTVDVSTDFKIRNEIPLSEPFPQDARRIPLLKDVLTLFAGQPDTKLSIQPKGNCVREIVQLVKETGTETLVGLNDGNLEYMKQVKQLAPEIHVFWDRPGDFDVDKDLKIARELHFEAMVIHHSGINPEIVTKIKQAGIETGAWTVNDEQRMKELLEMGVERIYTDYPGQLIEIKKDRTK